MQWSWSSHKTHHTTHIHTYIHLPSINIHRFLFFIWSILTVVVAINSLFQIQMIHIIFIHFFCERTRFLFFVFWILKSFFFQKINAWNVRLCIHWTTASKLEKNRFNQQKKNKLKPTETKYHVITLHNSMNLDKSRTIWLFIYLCLVNYFS